MHRPADRIQEGLIHRAAQGLQGKDMAAEYPEGILGLPGIQSPPSGSPAAIEILARASNPTGAIHRPHGHCGPVDHRRIQEGPAQRIGRLQPGPGTAMGQMHRPDPGEAQRINWAAAEPGQLRARQLPVLHRLGLDPCALTALPLVAVPLVAVNQKDGGNHGACNAGPRRVPRRRSRARHRTVRRTSAGHQSAASLAPTLGAARTMEGPAAAAPIKSTA